MIGGYILLKFHEPSGAAIAVGAAAGFYLSALEMRISAKPWHSENTPDTETKPAEKDAAPRSHN